VKKAVRMVKPAEQEMFDAAVYYELQVAGLDKTSSTGWLRLSRTSGKILSAGLSSCKTSGVASCTDFHMAYSIEWMRMKLSCSQSPTPLFLSNIYSNIYSP
jgi:hypothetical protein